MSNVDPTECEHVFDGLPHCARCGFEPPPPRRVGSPGKWLDLKGHYVPCLADGRATLIGIQGAGLAVPVFTTTKKLVEASVEFDLDCFKAMIISDTAEFLVSIPGSMIIALDLYRTPEGRVRYHEVKRD